MRTYHIIDRRQRDANTELIHYTFNELKDYFKPDINNYEEDKDIFNEMLASWEKIEDLLDLEDYLQKEYGIGEAVPYTFEEDETEDEEVRQRANSFFETAR